MNFQGSSSKMEKPEVEAPEFFKVFMPTFSSESMWIPPAFVRKFMKKIPSMVNVRDENGKCWSLGVRETEEKVFFISTQWEDFVKEHNLERGDFLLFKYTSNASFQVKIYAKNGCKKQLTPLHHHHHHHSTTPANLDDTKPTTEELKSVGENTSKGDGDVQQTRNLYFLTTLSRDSLQKVRIPRAMLRGIRLEQEIVLRCQNNELWRVGTAYDKDGQAFISSKWSEFCKGKSIKINDKCLFELIFFGQSNICKEMKVSIVPGW